MTERLPRNTKPEHHKSREHKRHLAPSITERPKAIGTVIGAKHKHDAVLLTKTERQTRFEVILKINDKASKPVTQAKASLIERAGEHMPSLFQTTTSENDTNFSELYDTLKTFTDVYFGRPYVSYEWGTIENQHKFIRRFIPKGSRFQVLVSDSSKAFSYR